MHATESTGITYGYCDPNYGLVRAHSAYSLLLARPSLHNKGAGGRAMMTFELGQSGGTTVLTRRYISVVGVNAEFHRSISGVNPDIGWS